MRASRLLLRQRMLLLRPLVRVRSSSRALLLLQRHPATVVGGGVLFRPLSHKGVDAKVLQDETDLLLASQDAAAASTDIVQILHRWQSHPDPLVAAEMSEALLHHWLSYPQNKKLDTAEPFLLVMKSWHKLNDSHRAANVLELWNTLLEGDLELAPTREAFHILLQTLANNNQGSEESCLSLLEYMERMQSIGNLFLAIDTETYAHVVTCLTKSAVTVEDQYLQWQRIKTMLERLNAVYQQEEPRHVYFRLQAYSQVVCLAVSVDLDAALTLLQEMSHTDWPRAIAYWKQQEEVLEMKQPTHLVGIAYTSVLSKLLALKDAKQMDALLTRLEKDDPNHELPWPHHYKMTIEGWSKTILDKPETVLDLHWEELLHSSKEERHVENDDSVKQIGLHCEELLRRMEARHLNNEHNSVKQISLETYERVLRMYMKCQHPAEHLLAHVMALVEANKIPRSERHLTACWNHCLKAYFYQDQPDSTLKLWHRMQSRNVTSDSVTYAFVLLALSRRTTQQQPDSARYAQHILTLLQKESDNNNNNIMATATHYGAVLVALSRSSGAKGYEADAVSAHALLKELEQAYDETENDQLQPTAIMYNAVITGWGRSGRHDAAIKVLERMKKRCRADQKRCPAPNVMTYNAVLDALSRQCTCEAAEKAESLLLKEMMMMEEWCIRPRQVSYTSVMSAWVRSGSPDAPERVMNIYTRLLAAYKESGHSMLLRPDEVTFGLLLDMWAKSKRSDAGERAEGILREDMPEYNVAANVVNYNNVILAHARSKQPLAFCRAEALLREMEELYSAGNETVKPNTVTHTNVIQALKQSQIQDKAQTAWDLLRNMLRAYQNGNESVRPNVITFNSVITACAHTTVGDDDDDKTRQQQRAVQLALATVAEMEQQNVAPNSTTFRMLLEAIGRQISQISERTRMAAIVFNRCRRENLVDSGVVDVVRRFMPSLLYTVRTSILPVLQTTSNDESCNDENDMSTKRKP